MDIQRRQAHALGRLGEVYQDPAAAVDDLASAFPMHPGGTAEEFVGAVASPKVEAETVIGLGLAVVTGNRYC